GFSVTSFLVGKSNRPAFLNFVADGMRGGWDAALQRHYEIRNVEELEQKWWAHLRETKRQPTQLASARPNVDRPRGTLTRQTAPPAQPFEDMPQAPVRAVAPDPERDYPGKPHPTSRPGYLPDYAMPIRPASTDGWQVPPSTAPPAVRLGPPQFDSRPPAQLGRPVPSGASPLRYPQ